MDYDFFNGDADGMISLHQFRMYCPANTIKHTGIKRDIDLLRYAAGLHDTKLYVFDLSLESNETHVSHALANGNKLVWFDHHTPGALLDHENIKCYIDTDPNVCTSWLVDQYIDGMHRPWTIAGAYGDNLHELAKKINPSFTDERMSMLKMLGETLNYSGYGNTEADLISHPLETYKDMSKYEDPIEYVNKSGLFDKIHQQFERDTSEMESSEVLYSVDCGDIILLPDTTASVRCSGIHSNKLATQNPDKAYIILTNKDGGYKASIRAPLNAPRGASKLAKQVDTGGGREKAAGINYMPLDSLDRLKEMFVEVFSSIV